METETVPGDKFRKLSLAGFILDIAGFVLILCLYVFCGVLPFGLGIIPDIPALRIGLLILCAAVLAVAFVLQMVAAAKMRDTNGRFIAGLVVWLFAAGFLLILSKLLVF